MLTHIKTHIQFHLSQRQFRLLLLLLAISSEYTFLVTPGTFASGIEQILSATGTTVSQTGTANLTAQVRQKKVSYSVASRVSSLPAKEEKNISNADGWMTISDETLGSWITFDKKITTQTASNTSNNKNTSNQTPSNALPPSFNAAPSVPSYNPNYLYPTTPISETAYTIATSYPSGNPGKTVNSTSDVPEGTNLYYTDARVQTAMSGTVSTTNTTIDTLSGRIATNETNITSASGRLITTETNISTLSGNLDTTNSNLNFLSGTVSSNFSTLLASLATKIGLTSLSSTGGISYDNATGLFSDLFTFSNGLTRIGNSIGISSVTGAQLSGFTTGQLTFGTASGGLASTGGLFWDNTNGRLGIGTINPGKTLDIVGTLQVHKTEGSVQDNILKILSTQNTSISDSNWRGRALFGAQNMTLLAGVLNGNALLGAHSWSSADNETGASWTNLFLNWDAAGSGGGGNVLMKGNVGIGTSSPNSKLEIDNTTANTSGLRFTRLTSTGTSSSLFSGILGVNSTGDVGIAQLTGNSFTGFTTGQLTFGTSTGGLTQSSNLFWNNASGSLGIGTNAPAYKLNIVDGNASLRFGAAIRATTDAFFQLRSQTTSNWARIGTNSSPLAILTQGTDETSTGVALFINNNGNVGIGTTSPSMKLVVQDSTSTASGMHNKVFGAYSTALSVGASSQIAWGAGNSTNNQAEFNFYYAGNGSSSNYVGIGLFGTPSTLAVLANSRVGIGTTTPNSKLELNSGTGGLSGLRFTQLLSSSASNGQYSGILGVNSTGDVGIAQVTGNNFAGFTGGQLTFGTTSGGLSSTGGLFWDNTNGRLGIGTSSPNVTLHTVGSSIFDGKIIVGNSVNHSNITNVINRNSEAGANAFRPINLIDTAASIKIARVGGHPSIEFQEWNTNLTTLNTYFDIFGTNNSLGFRDRITDSTIMTLLASGRMGIGTTTPNAKLELNSGTGGLSGLRFTQLLSSSASNGQYSGILGVNSTGDVGIAQLTGNSFTGFTAGQLTFGTASGGLTSNSNLFWDNTNANILLGRGNQVRIGNISGDSYYPGIWFGNEAVAPDFTNYSFLYEPTVGTLFNAPTGKSIAFRIGNSAKAAFNTNGLAIGNGNFGPNSGVGLSVTIGNVGIGTSSPNTKLEIDNTTANTSGLRFTRLTSTGASSSLFSGILGVNSTGDVGIAQVTGNNFAGFTGGQLTFGTASGGLSSTGGLFWDNTNARLGIGTNTPAARLSIIGTKTSGYVGRGIVSITDDSAMAANVGGGIEFWGKYNTAGALTSVGGIDSYKSNATDGDYGFGLRFAYRKNGSASPSTGLTLDSTGNIGIGTTTPNSKLELNSGTGGLSGLRFTQLLSSSASNAQFSGILGVNSTGDVGIAQLTGNSFTGFANGQLTFGTSTGRLTQSSNLFWDNTNGRLGIGISNPQQRFTISGTSAASVLSQSNISSFSGNGLRINGSASNSQDAITYQANAGGGAAIAFRRDGGFGTFIDFYTNNTAVAGGITQAMTINSAGNIGIGTTTPTANLHASGSVRFSSFGAGTLTTDANGNLSVSSDERLKDTQGDFTKGLTALEHITPIAYKWNSISGLETTGIYYGFSAQNVKESLPEAVGTDNRGYLTLSDRPILATLVNAVKELNTNKASTGAIETLSGRLALLSQASGSTVVNNYYNSGTTSSGTSSSWIDTAFSFVSSLLVRVEATFSEMVTFMKSVVFRSTVTFEDRVTFSDTDMAGTATIRAGESSVRVDFSHPYSEIPRVTVTADAFVTYRVTDKMVTGFTIETQSPVSTDTNFDWIAIMVRGLVTTTIPTAPTQTSPSSDTTPPAPGNSPSETSSSGTVTPESNTGTTSPTESGSTTPPDTEITPPPDTTQTTVSGEVTP